MALLVAEDYEPTPGRPDWGSLGKLPGVWQDLARVHRRLEALGFGEIVVLAAGERNGSRRAVGVRGLSALSAWEPEGRVEIPIRGPATRAAIVQAANQLKDHLNAHRTADDGRGGEVPPMFVFYYSGHGFVDSKGVHRLPLADNVAGEPTGDLLELVLDTVGADDEMRGSAGGGSSLVFLDCCQAGQGFAGGSKAGGPQGGLLEASIMDAIRAGRRGRFFVGASLGDETAKESASGGYFTGALCAALQPGYLGQERQEERTLSLNHLVLTVDQRLLKQGGQAVSRVPAAADPQWENWVLFPNPHYQGKAERMRLIVNTLPPEVPVQVLGWEKEGFLDLGLFAAPFVQEAAGSRSGRLVYGVPDTWREQTLRLQAVPVRAADRVKYESSPEATVVLKPDAQGTPPIAALALRQVGYAGGASVEDAEFQRAQAVYQQAQQTPAALERFRQFQTAHALLKDSTHPFAGPVRNEIASQLARVRPEAGRIRLEELIRIATAPVRDQRYRKAYDALAALEEEPAELREFGLAAGETGRQVAAARQKLLTEWKEWAVQQRRKEADQRLSRGKAFLASGQPWHSWRQAFESEVLVGADERSRGLSQRSVESAVSLFFQQQVSLEVLVSNSAYGILRELVQGTGVFVKQLQKELSQRFSLDPADLGNRLKEDQETFRQTYASWFPPDVASGWSGGGGELTVDLPGGATMEFVWIEPGTFLMGSPDSEPGRDNDEGPPHRVTISKGFYLGKYEITQGQWEVVMRARPWSGQDYVQANASHPAVYISWDDVQGFIGKLNQAEGREVYRLPTEAEWEYACRAGTSTVWPFGNDESQLGDYAWYDENAWNANLKYAQPVGTKLPNPWGLHDMLGNVWEWCQDWKGSYSSGSQTDPTGPSSGAARVYRGGNFSNSARYARPADRGSGSPGGRSGAVGARLLRTQ